MKILFIWASADWSISDVARGYENALRELGHEVKVFRYSRRIEFWAMALANWQGHQQYEDVDVEQVLKEASSWSVIEAGYFDPDLVLISSGMGFHPDACILLRKFGYKVGVVLTECPYDDDKHEQFIPYVDYVFANDWLSLDRLQQVNPATYYLPTGYDPTFHRPPPSTPVTCDVVFVGTGFPERQRILESIDWSDIDLDLYGFWGWATPERTETTLEAQDPIPNEWTPVVYAGAEICLNFYRDGAAYSMNPRAYELAACGAFQLAQDCSREAHEIFGDSIAYFKPDGSDLEAQIRYWLSRPGRRQEMAEEARERIQGHTYLDRAKTLFSHVYLPVGVRSVDRPVDFGRPLRVT